MLRQVSNGQYLEAIRMAEKFILHVEVLFATIDDLEWQFSRLNLKGASLPLCGSLLPSGTTSDGHAPLFLWLLPLANTRTQ